MILKHKLTCTSNRKSEIFPTVDQKKNGVTLAQFDRHRWTYGFLRRCSVAGGLFPSRSLLFWACHRSTWIQWVPTSSRVHTISRSTSYKTTQYRELERNTSDRTRNSLLVQFAVHLIQLLLELLSQHRSLRFERRGDQSALYREQLGIQVDVFHQFERHKTGFLPNGLEVVQNRLLDFL